ncbi:MAG: hypothetical protein ACIWVG_10225, partial [Gloeotrichia echinulata HAB0833]
IYDGDKLIASITYDDDDFVTQRWVVMVNSVEEHRADTWAKCHNYIIWHYKQGTLPVQQHELQAFSTGNEVMVQIAVECEKFGFELLNDGIYHNDVKLGEVGCTLVSTLRPTQCIASLNSLGRWWVKRASSNHQQQVPCDSAFDAVWSLSMVEVLPDVETGSCDELTASEWKALPKNMANVVAV